MRSVYWIILAIVIIVVVVFSFYPFLHNISFKCADGFKLAGNICAEDKANFNCTGIITQDKNALGSPIYACGRDIVSGEYFQYSDTVYRAVNNNMTVRINGRGWRWYQPCELGGSSSQIACNTMVNSTEIDSFEIIYLK